MSKELTARIREQIYPADVLKGDRPPTLEERPRLVNECVSVQLPILSAALVMGKSPKHSGDRNWRGRALEAYLGGRNTSLAVRDFEDGELKSTRVLRNKHGQWKIEQALRITSLIHANGAHLKPCRETPLYHKISCFTCVLIDSVKGEINSGSFVGSFVFKIGHDTGFDPAIREDYEYYLDYVNTSGSTACAFQCEVAIWFPLLSKNRWKSRS